jgi:hypothetical protein
MAAEAQGDQVSMIDDRDSGPGFNARPKGGKLELATARVVELAKAALEHRMTDLSGLSKKNMAEGYPAAARTQSIDANVIKTELLPQLERQLALDTDGQDRDIGDLATKAFRAGIERTLRLTWDRARASKTDRPDDLVEESARQLANHTGATVAGFAEELYNLAYEAGLSERRGTFARCAAQAAKALG